jgi:hypothetical protein
MAYLMAYFAVFLKLLASSELLRGRNDAARQSSEKSFGRCAEPLRVASWSHTLWQSPSIKLEKGEHTGEPQGPTHGASVEYESQVLVGSKLFTIKARANGAPAIRSWRTVPRQAVKGRRTISTSISTRTPSQANLALFLLMARGGGRQARRSRTFGAPVRCSREPTRSRLND